MKRWQCYSGIGLMLLAGCTPTKGLPLVEELPPRTPIVVSVDKATSGAIPPAEPGLEGAHPVEHYVQIALARNPEILARQRRVKAQEAVVPQATALPDPMLGNISWPAFQYSPQTAAGRMARTLQLSQQFPWHGKLALRGEIAEAETQIALTQLAQTELKVMEEVKGTYYEIFFAQRAIEITEENERFLRDYITLTETRYKVGQASQQDLLRSQVELDRLQDQLIQLRRQLKLAQADLAKLLATAPESDLRALENEVPRKVPQQLDQLAQLALTMSPELQGKLEAIFRDQQKIELAKLAYFPDVTLGFSWTDVSRDGALARTANGHDNVGVLLSLNLPIWKDKLDASVREAHNRAAESAWLYNAARDDTFRLLRRLTVQARTLEEQATLFREKIIPRADQTLRVSTADYRVGKVDALTVLDNYTTLLRFRVQLVRLEASLGQTLATLERVVGTELSKLPPEPAPELAPAPRQEEKPPMPQPPENGKKD